MMKKITRDKLAQIANLTLRYARGELWPKLAAVFCHLRAVLTSSSIVVKTDTGFVRISRSAGAIQLTTLPEANAEARLLEAQHCPARRIESSLSLKEMRQSLALQAETLLPGPVEAYAISGWCQTPEQTWIFFAPKDLLERNSAAIILPGSLGALALPKWLEEQQIDNRDGLWGFTQAKSWVLAKIEASAISAIRVLPQRDYDRLSLVIEELADAQGLRWVGYNGPESVPIIPAGAFVAEELAFTSQLISRLDGDLAPQSIARQLRSKRVRLLSWSASLLLLLLALLFFTDGALERRAIFAELGISSNDAESAVADMQTELINGQAPFPAESTLPNVSDVLRWLGGLPELQVERGVRIRQLHYQLSSWPTAGNERQPYKGRVTVEIVCPETMVARQILERLSEDGAGPIDRKVPLDWHHNQGTYKLSFQLATRPTKSFKTPNSTRGQP